MKRIFITALYILLFSGLLHSQIDTKDIAEKKKEILSSTENSLYIIRQDYLIEDANKENPMQYGFKNNDYFGRIYCLAVLSGNRLWCCADVRTPWKSDPNFSTYKDDKSFKPVLSKVAVRPVAGKDFVTWDMEICSQENQDKVLKDIPVTYYQLKIFSCGLPFICKNTDANGWLVVAYTQNELASNENSKIDLLVIKPSPNFRKDENGAISGKVEKNIEIKNILGGIYVSDTLPGGNMQVDFLGIYNKRLINYYVESIPETEPWKIIAADPQERKAEIRKCKECNSAVATDQNKACFFNLEISLKKWKEKRNKARECKAQIILKQKP